VTSGEWPLGDKAIKEMNMKAIISIITVSAAASLLNSPVSWAQETAPEPSVLPHAQEAFQVAQDEMARAQAEAQNAQAQAQKAQAEAKADFARAQQQQQQMERVQRDMASVAAGAERFGGDTALPKPEFTDRLQNILVRAPNHGAGKALVIRSSESDPKEQTQLEEDLAVMAHILEKAVSERAGGHGGQPYGAMAMGIDVFYTPAASPLRSLYLDGYGALFMLNVGFPLLPPPHTEGLQEKQEANSDWEDAKQEIYGQPRGGRGLVASGEPYDEERVNRLREGLLESLKNATNIRGLKPDDSITVCVFGGPSFGQFKAMTYVKRGTGTGEARSAREARTAVAVSGRDGSPMLQTIMTIRVKKSDADALAKGAMTLEAFRKRAHVVSYAGSPESGMPLGGMGGGVGGGMGAVGGFGGGSGGGGGGFGGGGRP
jgi:hypothetical protein